MKDEKTIKNIWKCSYIKSETGLYPLQKWYNQLIDKKISEIEVSDVLRMIRQNEFLDIAIYKAVKILKEDPFAGDMYEGELMEKVSKLEKGTLKQYRQEIMEFLEGALIKNETYEWLDENERKDFEKVIKDFFDKISTG